MPENTYKIQFDTVYLSQTGTNAEPFIKCSVSKTGDLKTTIIGQPTRSADGSVISNLSTWTKGKEFEISLLTWIDAAIWNSIISIINNALENNSTFTVAGIGYTGADFSFSVKPNPIEPFSESRFLNGRVYGAVLRLITQ